MPATLAFSDVELIALVRALQCAANQYERDRDAILRDFPTATNVTQNFSDNAATARQLAARIESKI